jgi:hypothetical protein
MTESGSIQVFLFVQKQYRQQEKDAERILAPFICSAVPSLIVRSGMNAIDEAGPGVTALCRGAVIPGLQFSVRDTVS